MAVAAAEAWSQAIVELPSIAFLSMSRKVPISILPTVQSPVCAVMERMRSEISATNNFRHSESGEPIKGMAIVSGDIMNEDGVVDVTEGIPVADEMSSMSALAGSSGVGISRSPKGRHIKERYIGAYSGLKRVYQHLIDEVAPSMGLQYNGGPVIELYYVVDAPESELVTEVCVPVS